MNLAAPDMNFLLGWGGAILGSVLGLLGGIIGTWLPIRNAKPGPEREVLIKWSIGFWVGILAILALMFLLPHPWRWLVWIPYPFALTWAVSSCNRQLATAAKQKPDPLYE
jgi:hypothetical protein